jgi:hypothetical protein
MRRRASLLLRLAGVAWALLAAVASAGWGLAGFARARHTVTRTTQTGSPVTKVDVRNDNGDIEFRAGSRGTITRTEAWNLVRPSYTQSLRSGTLTILARCPKNVPRNQCSVRLVITVPPTVDISARTTNGNVRATGFQSQAIAANSTNGDVRVSLDAQPASLSLGTTNGDVSAIASGKVRGAQSNVTAKSTNGNVNVSLKRPPTTLSLATVNGSIHGAVPAGSYRLTTRTVFGRVSLSGLLNDPNTLDAVSAQSVFGNISLSGG